MILYARIDNEVGARLCDNAEAAATAEAAITAAVAKAVAVAVAVATVSEMTMAATFAGHGIYGVVRTRPGPGAPDEARVELL